MTTLAEGIGGAKRVSGGPFGSKLTSADYVPEGVPVIRGSNMEQGGRWIGGAFAFVTREKVAADLSSNLARRGDIIVTQRGTLGQVSIVPDDADAERFVVSQSQMAISVDSTKASRDFVYYYLRSPVFEEYLDQSTIQTGVPHINLGILRQAPASWPEVAEQERIAAHLVLLDDKIELNRRMNETLEAMAQAIFRDWFVDFGPVRRRMEGATDPVAILGGLTPDPARAAELAALFPKGLGADGMPTGWRAATLNELAVHCKGSVTPLSRPDVDFEHYSLPAFDAGQEPAIDAGSSIKSNKTPVPDGSVLLSKLNPEISRVWLPNTATRREQIASTEFLIFKPRQGVGRGLLYFLFRDPTVRQILSGMVTGTSKSHQRVSPPSLLQTTLLAGGEAAFSAFEELVEPILQRVLSLRAENRTLAETRDYLLPRLMSGQVRVMEAAA